MGGKRLSVRNLGLYVPDRALTKHRYTALYAFTSGITGFYTRVMSANSVFDPDVSGIGDTSYWFNQMANLYGTYRVNASKVYAQIIPEAANNTKSHIFGVRYCPSDFEIWTAYSDAGALDGYTKSRVICNYQSGLPAGVKNYAKIRLAQNKTKMEFLPNAGYEGSSTADPSLQSYWQVFAQQIGASVDSLVINVRITLTYYTEWQDRYIRNAY